MSMIRYIRADFLKIRHTVLLWTHLVLPVLAITVFLWYYAKSPVDAPEKVQVYLQAVSLVFPLVIGILCPFVVGQEESAGNYQVFLGTARLKWSSFFSKWMALTILAFCSVCLTVGGFAVGYTVILKENPFPVRVYASMIIIIWGCQMFVYLFHLFLSFQYSRGVSVGMGIFEVLISALFLTNLGDRIWIFIPCSWSGRLCDYLLLYTRYKEGADGTVLATAEQVLSEWNKGITAVILMTCMAVLCSVIWFHYYEGRNIHD